MESRERRQLLKVILGLILIFNGFFAQATEISHEKEDPNPHYFRIYDIPEGPSLFVVAGINYLNQSSYCEVKLEAFESGRLNFQLSNLHGEVLHWDQKRIHQGINNIGLSLKEYPNGLYQLDMTFGEEEKTLIIEKISATRIKASLVQRMD